MRGDSRVLWGGLGALSGLFFGMHFGFLSALFGAFIGAGSTLTVTSGLCWMQSRAEFDRQGVYAGLILVGWPVFIGTGLLFQDFKIWMVLMPGVLLYEGMLLAFYRRKGT